MRTISSLLVANRGEIARRIIRTARAMGIRTVLVASIRDRFEPAAFEADVIVDLPGTTLAETYLNVDAIVAAAVANDVDAVHPGYGFLSEHAGFARAVEAAGITFVGPSAEAIEQMGSKVNAKAIVAAAGVPVLPSVVVTGDDEVLDFAAREGWPVLLKASAGGGGRGMRILAGPDDVAGALSSARREAEHAFSDATVFVEPYVLRPRHVEVQILGDHQGTVVDLFERECSIQRRHQKVVEESPSPGIDEPTRQALRAAARAVGESIRYVGAGTVEFVVGPDGRFAFLEVNTRLQVEHPVTEAVTGLDLVELQLRVASGAPLPSAAIEATSTGHAIEVRLYAEQPSAGYLPQTGFLQHLDLGHDGVRVDSGVEAGSFVTDDYDPMLAKVIAVGATRREAAATVAAALRRAIVDGVTTNRNLLVGIVEDPTFLDGEATTAFLDERSVDELEANQRARHAPLLAAVVLDELAQRAAEGPLPDAVPVGFRNALTAPFVAELEAEGRRVEVAVVVDGRGAQAVVDGGPTSPVVDFDVHGSVCVVDGVDLVAVEVTGDRGGARTAASETDAVVVSVLPRFVEPSARLAAGSLTAPMPGTVARVDVAPGDVVEAGTVLVVLEAMKMEHVVRAPRSGTVVELDVAVGTQVAAGDQLVVLEEVQSG